MCAGDHAGMRACLCYHTTTLAFDVWGLGFRVWWYLCTQLHPSTSGSGQYSLRSSFSREGGSSGTTTMTSTSVNKEGKQVHCNKLSRSGWMIQRVTRHTSLRVYVEFWVQGRG